MPVQQCRDNDKPGYKWGEAGRCYTYTPDNEASRKAAKRKAILQGVAIEGGDVGNVEIAQAAQPIQETTAENNTLEMVTGQFSDILAVTELRGSYPNVPLAAGVDYESLIAGDEEPMFLTLPIGEIDSKSVNGRYYDAAWIAELERQTLANKPVGLMGHLKPDERATVFPEEAIHWVGAAHQGNQLWGKGYVPPGSVRDRIKRYKAQGKAIATSIDAFADGKWDESLAAYRMDAKTLRLNQIDLAPADRAGIPSLAAVPYVTTEMQPGSSRDESENESEQETENMDRIQIIREMTADDAPLIPKPVRAAILADVPVAEEIDTVAQIREILEVDDKADLPKLITELRQTETRRKQEDVDRRITELVTDKDAGIKVEAMRGMVTELVRARKPQTAEEAEMAYKQICEMESVKTALAGHVQETMGPPQRTPLAGQNGKTAKYFAIPEREG